MNVPPTHFVRVPAEKLQGFVEACLSASHLVADQAQLIASLLTRCDLQGVHSHGAQRMPGYCRDLQAGQINPAPQIRTVREELLAVVVDGDGGLGYAPMIQATQAALARAQASGLGVGVVGEGLAAFGQAEDLGVGLHRRAVGDASGVLHV